LLQLSNVSNHSFSESVYFDVIRDKFIDYLDKQFSI